MVESLNIRGKDFVTGPACKNSGGNILDVILVCQFYMTLQFKPTEHMNEHFNTDIKELTCEICNSVMRTKQKLKLHKETHGVAKYACDICGKLFRFLCALI
jgi:hypothetical protein